MERCGHSNIQHGDGMAWSKRTKVSNLWLPTSGLVDTENLAKTPTYHVIVKTNRCVSSNAGNVEPSHLFPSALIFVNILLNVSEQ